MIQLRCAQVDKGASRQMDSHEAGVTLETGFKRFPGYLCPTFLCTLTSDQKRAECGILTKSSALMCLHIYSLVSVRNELEVFSAPQEDPRFLTKSFKGKVVARNGHLFSDYTDITC